MRPESDPVPGHPRHVEHKPCVQPAWPALVFARGFAETADRARQEYNTNHGLEWRWRGPTGSNLGPSTPCRFGSQPDSHEQAGRLPRFLQSNMAHVCRAADRGFAGMEVDSVHP